ncbi:hypothetical protein ABZ847_29490 [Streptomyces bauhiniae]
MNDDILIACVDLAGRAGATDVEIGHTGDDDTPAHQVRWYAVATYRGARLIADDHQSPTAAAMTLAERLLAGARCRCTAMITLSDGQPGCRWRLVGSRWEPGCDAPPLRVEGPRGDVAAMERALGNRAARRAAKRGRR